MQCTHLDSEKPYVEFSILFLIVRFNVSFVDYIEIHICEEFISHADRLRNELL